jgi:putative DNA primase/helicase
MFSTWGAKAIAMIGRLPDTLASRSIVIPMRRKRADEKTERLRADIDQGFCALQSRLARWTADTGNAITNTDPDIPSVLSDRQADCWRELFRVADIAAGEWPAKARRAAVAICNRDDEEEGDLSTRLLIDLSNLFASDPERDSWASSDIIEYLNNLEPSPWPDYGHGHGIDANKLARILKRFNITPKNIAVGSKRLKGYHTQAFDDIFARYLPQSCYPATYSVNSLQYNDLDGSGKSSGSGYEPLPNTQKHQEPGDTHKSSGIEALPLPEPLLFNSLHGNDLGNLVAAERLSSGSNEIKSMANWPAVQPNTPEDSEELEIF